MRPPDLDAGLCRKFSPEELERTFFYPGPQDVAKTPTAFAQRAWDQAKEVCIECPVFLLCRKNSLGFGYGVVGGLDEHERHILRRRMTVQLGRMGADERAQLAEYFHVRHGGGLGDSVAVMARLTGYSDLAIKALMAEHAEALERRRAASRPAPQAPETRPQAVPEFPGRRPARADGWVWYRGRMMAGHYLAQAEDGAFVYMKIKCSGSQTAKWFPADHVNLRTAIIPVVRTWAGRPDGIQAIAQDDQRAGQSAA